MKVEKNEKFRTFEDPMSVKWAKKYEGEFSAFWDKIPNSVREILIFLAVFSFGVSVNGEWMNLWVHLSRQWGYTPIPSSRILKNREWSFEAIGLKDFWKFFIFSNIVSYGIYIFVGGFIHWYYYIRQRNRPEEWKCQPTKFLPPELERHEIILGSCTLFWNATMSSFMSCFIANGGHNTVYYRISDYGYLWFFLQVPLVFIYQDYSVYWIHRIFHYPFMFKHFHKLHHTYKQPTVWSVTAIHPVETTTIQLVQWLPLFTIPVHWAPFYLTLIYTYYHAILDHSGVNFKSYWWQPWQPDAIFHDNHHQYTHVNFGFNIYIWDRLHDTYRKKDRIYNDDTFYGTGKSFKESSQEEIDVDIKERNSENPLAYRNNKLEYQLDEGMIGKKE